MADNRSPANPKGTYNVRALREDVLNARKLGAKDDEIIAELRDDPVLGPKIDKMLAAGVQPTQALNNVAVILKNEKYDPTEGMSTMEKAVAGIGMSFDKMGRGVKQFVGSPFAEQETRDRWAKENADADRTNAALRDTAAGKGGEIFGDLITTMAPGMGPTMGALKMIPHVAGAGKLALAANALRAGGAAAAGGMGVQAVTPESTALNDAGDYASKLIGGAAEGVTGDILGRGAGRLLKPLRFNIPKEHIERLNRLSKFGIGKDTPTNNQRGAFDLAQLTNDQTAIDLKSSLSKLPLASSAVEGRTNAQLGDLTQAAMARAGMPEARSVSPKSLTAASDALDAREAVFKGMGPVDLDPDYARALQDVRKATAPSVAMTGQGKDVYKALDAGVRMSKGGRSSLPAPTALDVRRDLSDETHRAYMAGNSSITPKVLTKVLGGAQDALDDAIRRSFERQSPGAGEAWDLYRKNRGAYLDISKAAGGPAGRGKGDVINPKALAEVMRGTQGRSRFAAGQSGELGTLADDATRVLTDQVPNSGTPQRSLYSMLLLSGPKFLTNAAGSDKMLMSALGHISAGPLLAHHAMYGKGPLGAKHLAFGVPGSDNLIDALQKTSPAFTAALIERLRQEQEGER